MRRSLAITNFQAQLRTFPARNIGNVLCERCKCMQQSKPFCAPGLPLTSQFNQHYCLINAFIFSLPQFTFGGNYGRRSKSVSLNDRFIGPVRVRVIFIPNDMHQVWAGCDGSCALVRVFICGRSITLRQISDCYWSKTRRSPYAPIRSNKDEKS